MPKKENEFNYWLSLAHDIEKEGDKLKWWQFWQRKLNNDLHSRCIDKAWELFSKL